MRDIKCCLCGSDESRLYCHSVDYISGKSFDTTRCNQCGLIFVNPQPAEKELHLYYAQTHQSSEPASYEVMDATPRYKLIQRLFSNKPGKILDLGCGKGLLLKKLKNRGWDVYGTELSEASRAVAQRSGVKVYKQNPKDCPFEKEMFDAVVMYHSLEHMTNPKETLSTIQAILKVGGLLIVEVPNKGSWYGKLFGCKWFHFDVPRHLFHFDSNTLPRMLRATNFKVIETKNYNVQYDAFGTVQSILNQIMPTQNLLNNYNTGETPLKELWSNKNRWINLSSLFASEIFLAIGFPIFAITSILLSPFAEGGTLRYVAKKQNNVDEL